MWTIVGFTVLSTVFSWWASAAQNKIMIDMIWQLIGIIPGYFSTAALSIIVALMDESFFKTFNFFSSSTLESNATAGLIAKTITPLTTFLDALSGLILAVGLGILIYKIVFEPFANGKGLHPLRALARFVIVLFLFFTWKRIVGLYLSIVNQGIQALGTAAYNSVQSLADVNIGVSGGDESIAKFKFLGLILDMNKSVNTVFSTDNVNYILQAILIMTLSMAIIKAAFAFIERYISFIFYLYIGGPFIALGITQETSSVAVEWAKGILTQTIGIGVAMSGIILGVMEMLTEVSNNAIENYAGILIAVVFFNFSANSERFLNTVGLRTMPNGELAKSFSSGVGTLTSVMGKLQPITSGAAATAAIPQAIGAIRSGASMWSRQAIRRAEMKGGSLENNAKLSGSAGNIINGINNSLSDKFSAAKATHDNFKDAEKNLIDTKTATEADYNYQVKDINNAYNDAKKQANEKFEETTAGLSEKSPQYKEAEQTRNQDYADAGTRRDTAIKEAETVRDEKIADAQSSYDEAKEAHTQAVNDLNSAKDQSNVKSGDVFKNGTDDKLQYFHDDNGQMHAVGQIKYKDAAGVEKYANVEVPLGGQQGKLREGDTLYKYTGDGKTKEVASINSTIITGDGDINTVKYSKQTSEYKPKVIESWNDYTSRTGNKDNSAQKGPGNTPLIRRKEGNNNSDGNSSNNDED